MVRPSRRGSKRRWKWSFPTSIKFSNWGSSDYVGNVAQMMDYSSPQLPKTPANQPRFFLHRSKRAKPDRNGARAPFRSPLSAPAARCFSTKWAESGRLLRLEPMAAVPRENGPSVRGCWPSRPRHFRTIDTLAVIEHRHFPEGLTCTPY